MWWPRISRTSPPSSTASSTPPSATTAQGRAISPRVGQAHPAKDYGVDGKRLRKVENLAATQDCTTIPATTPSTYYFSAIEIRNWKVANVEQVIAYPHPSLKLVNGFSLAAATYLHRDALGSVRAITAPGPVKLESAVYKPFGEQSEWLSPSQTAPETKGWIGTRYDADAGLQYLNARYYDPSLGMFLQPDWFEVTTAGVGTNRFSYSFNDPVNKFDPGGNSLKEAWNGFRGGVGRFFSGAATGAAKNADLRNTRKGAVLGAATGLTIGVSTGTGLGCAASACTGTIVTTPVGAVGGFLLGGLLGSAGGLILDGSEVVSGAIAGGYDAVVSGDKTKVVAVKIPDPKRGAAILRGLLGMTSAGLGLHANSLMSPRKTELYHLVRISNPGTIDKIGITSAPNGGPAGRYTQSELDKMGVDYVSVQTFNNRLDARIAEVAETLAYVQQHGSFPKYTFRW